MAGEYPAQPAQRWGGGDDPEEEELAKETGEGSHHHPEETEINLVVNIDRRVSLMVTLKGPRLLKYFPRLLNVSKKPLRPPPPPIPTFKDSYKDFPRFRANLWAYLNEFYSTVPEKCA